jgi:LIVCS family branched-chain amino acid:cation transporter
MLKPFIPVHFLREETLLASFIFALIFFTITFLCTYKESRVVDLLGYVISPIKIGALVFIITKGLWYAVPSLIIDITPSKAFTTNLLRGYETLDLLAAIFFAYVILTILKKAHYDLVNTPKKRALLCLQSGAIGLSVLALVYAGMILLGYYYRSVIAPDLDAGQMFREIALYILGPQGGLLIAVAIVVACLSTAIALAATFSEYLKIDIFKGKISFVQALLITFILCLPLSTFGLGQVLRLTGGPIVFIGYPVLIMLTICNIAYKLFDFKPVKIPVILTLVAATLIYYSSSLIG